MEHGGDLLTYKDKYGGKLIDFSSNINPLGVPRGLEKAIMDAFKEVEVYPDIQYRKLKEALANYLDCEKANILVGNGAVEIIDNFIMLAERVVLFIPSFSEYELRAGVHKKEVLVLEYGDDFTIEVDILKKNLKENDLLILGNPNNPSGLRIAEETLLEIYACVQSVKGHLLLDEAFYEFCPKDYDSIELFKDTAYKNVSVIRAATKFFALAGIRLGYACGSQGTVEKISSIELPWRINSMANTAGLTIFKDTDYIKKSKDYIRRQRDYLFSELKKIKAVKPYTSHTNFILIKLLDLEEDYLFEELLKEGILVRKCSSFKGLGRDHIRVAVKDKKSNDLLIKALKDITKV